MATLIDSRDRGNKKGVQSLSTLSPSPVSLIGSAIYARTGRIAITDAEFNSLKQSTGENIPIYNLYSRTSSIKENGVWRTLDQVIPNNTYYVDQIDPKIYFISFFGLCSEMKVKSIITRAV